VDEKTLESTRRSLHAVAESLLAGPQYRASGTIRLQLTTKGFKTRAEPELLVEGAQVIAQGHGYPLSGVTLKELGAMLGVEAAGPGNYHDGADAGPDEPIEVDPEAAEQMFKALNMGQEGLRSFAPQQEPVLWPEHFDVGILVNDVAYGVSPGDRHIGMPYAYVSAQAPDDDPYWNESFGAAKLISELGSAENIAQFFNEGQSRLSG